MTSFRFTGGAGKSIWIIFIEKAFLDATEIPVL